MGPALWNLIGHSMKNENQNKCQFQQDSSDPGIFYCRNPNVIAHHNLVPMKICQGCTRKDEIHQNPRPELIPQEIHQLVKNLRDKKPSPSATQQATNVIRAVTDTISSMVAGNSLFATPETAAARWKTCEGCEYRNNNTCSLCGCGLKAKTQIASQACPAGKWEPEVKGKAPSKPEVPGKPKWAE